MDRKWRTVCFLMFVMIAELLACTAVPPPAPAPSPQPTVGETAPAFPSPTSLPPTATPTVPPPTPAPSPTPQPSFAFAVAADIRIYAGPGRYDSPRFFRGACEAIAALGEIAFMVSPGDIDPPAGVLWTLTTTLGTDFRWYPAVGNHEVETPEDMNWLRSYDYGPVNPGPSGCPTTTYSFDYENAHFVVLNVYCDVHGDTVTDGDIPDHLYTWLAADLAATTKPHIFVFGHEPAFPQPDALTGRVRHLGGSLDAHPTRRDRFWKLLRERGVRAYICGHTHNYSAVQVEGVWQLDAGHARGMGDTGAPSTFLIIRVDGPTVTFEAYRDDMRGGPYRLVERGTLSAGP